MAAVSRRPQRVTRSVDDRWVAGVAGGLARWLGIHSLFVRLAFIAALPLNGLGFVVYVVAWIVLPSDGQVASGWRETVSTRLGRSRLTAGDDPAVRARRPQLEQVLGIGCLVLGTVLLLRNVGLWFSDQLVWPVILVSGGAAVVWSRSDESERARWTAMAARWPGRPLESFTTGSVSLARLFVGGVLVLAGLGVFLAANNTIEATRQVLLAVLVTVAGLGLMLGPWVARLLADLRDERRERIRSEERAEMAAHLHDSVLQTLALIQRNADRPRELIALARRQERELRSWLYGDAGRRSGGSLVAALEGLAGEVEALHEIDVDVVTVGDRPMDDRLVALAGAIREAVVNAAKHSGAPTVSVYAEVEDDRVGAFVRDRGQGFDLDAVAPDRQGIMLSIRERVERHGGRVTMSTEPGEGTEVQLEMPYQ